jgi:hypothetical protein
MDPSSSLEARLARLEQNARRWRVATTLLAGILGITVLSGSVWKDSPRLDVRELRLIDEQGRARLLLTLADTGHPKMLMVDADGQIRAQYTSELLAFEDRGTPRVRMGYGNGLQLFDRQGQQQADLSVGTGSFLTLYNRPERGFARLGIDRNGVKYATQSTSAAVAETNSR